jgi:hypothetical protein
MNTGIGSSGDSGGAKAEANISISSIVLGFGMTTFQAFKALELAVRY